MKPAVEDLVARAAALFAGASPAFDPGTLARTFSIAATDYTEVIILPPLLARLRVEAPNVDLATSFVGDDLERSIKARDVDLGIGTRFRASPGIVEARVGDQDMRVLVRRGHPATRGRLTPQRYAAFDHALVTPRGLPGGVVDEALEKVGLRRRVVLRLPHFVVAAFVVAESDLVVSVPRAVAEYMAERAPLVVLPLPVEVAAFRFSIAYSTTMESDPAHTWFRTVCLEVAREMLGRTSRPRPASRPR
jgi:DNA-binding transcriptional LysR family regulator